MNKQQLPPLPVIDAIDKWMHQQTRFHLSDTDGYQEMLTEVAQAVDQYAYEYAERVIGSKDSVEQEGEEEWVVARNNLRTEQHKLNKELSSHKEDKENNMIKYDLGI